MAYRLDRVFMINTFVRFIIFTLILCEFLVFLVLISSINNGSRILILIPRFLFTGWVRVASVIWFQISYGYCVSTQGSYQFGNHSFDSIYPLFYFILFPFAILFLGSTYFFFLIQKKKEKNCMKKKEKNHVGKIKKKKKIEER